MIHTLLRGCYCRHGLKCQCGISLAKCLYTCVLSAFMVSQSMVRWVGFVLLLGHDAAADNDYVCTLYVGISWWWLVAVRSFTVKCAWAFWNAHVWRSSMINTTTTKTTATTTRAWLSNGLVYLVVVGWRLYSHSTVCMKNLWGGGLVISARHFNKIVFEVAAAVGWKRLICRFSIFWTIILCIRTTCMKKLAEEWMNGWEIEEVE